VNRQPALPRAQPPLLDRAGHGCHGCVLITTRARLCVVQPECGRADGDAEGTHGQDRATAIRVPLSGTAGGLELGEIAARLAPLHPKNDTFPGDVLLELAADGIEESGASREQPLEFEGIRKRHLPGWRWGSRRALRGLAAASGFTGSRCQSPWIWLTLPAVLHRGLLRDLRVVSALRSRLGRRLWVVGRAGQDGTSAADEGPGRRADWSLGPPGEREAPAYLGAGDGDGAEFSRVGAGDGFGQDGQAEASGGELGKDLGIAGLEGDVWLESGRGTGVVEA
jgi:hypothetical protein